MNSVDLDRFEELRAIRKYPLNLWASSGYNDGEYRQLYAMLAQEKDLLNRNLLGDNLLLITGDCLDNADRILRTLKAIKSL